MMKKFLLGMVLMTVACTAGQRTTATAPVAAVRNPDFKNVQVLPHTMNREQLIKVMRSFTRGLGVRCDHCHVVTATTPEVEFDFPSDAKEEKRVARVMIQMTQQINKDWLERVEAAEDPHEEEKTAEASEEKSDVPRVNCWTCHRGKTEPEMPPPPPPRS